ncbi:MAG: class I SAM-dependent methyltransferase [Desulfobulbaceae bacterium]|nr:class I SAM-dependent methyltransferase [Desulfobulbaceae bacterium]
MKKRSPFDLYVEEYEQWFSDHPWVYKAEVEAVRTLLPLTGFGIEIGLGTGRFAEPLGISVGVEPSRQMAVLARQRGVQVVYGVAENLPVCDASIDFVLMVTTICFVANIDQALREAYRILSPGGLCLLGLVDRTSVLGQQYLQKQGASVFYQDAVFYSVDETIVLMKQAGFHDFSCSQTIFSELSGVKEDEPVHPGYGQGSFVVVRGRR